MKFIISVTIYILGFTAICMAQKLPANGAILKKADSLYFKQHYKNAAQLYNSAFRSLSNYQSLDFYRCAAANARAKNIARSLDYLNLLITSGRYKNYSYLLTDSNFANISKSKYRHQLEELVQMNKEKIEDVYGNALTAELLEIKHQKLHEKRIEDSLYLCSAAIQNKWPIKTGLLM